MGTRKLRLRRLWADLPLLAKGLVTLIIPLAVLITVILFFYLFEKKEHEADAWLAHSFAVRDSVGRVQTLLVDAETGINGYIITGDADWLVSYSSARAALPDALVRLEQLETNDPNHRTLVARMHAEVDRYLSDLEALRNAAPGPNQTLSDSARSRMASAKATMDGLQSDLTVMRASEARLLEQGQDDLENLKERILGGIHFAVLLGAAAALASLILLIGGVVRRIQRLQGYALQLEAGEPLVGMEPDGDEVGRLGQTLANVSAILARREADLRETSAFLEHVIETGPAVILRRRPADLGVLFVSRNAERLLGYAPEELLRSPEAYDTHVHPDDVERFHGTYRDVLDRRETQHETEYRFLHRDGTYRWLWGVARINYGPDGQPEDILGYALDVTARKLAEMDAQRAREDAERANRAKSEFLSRMSHELRTPLNAISGFSQLLELDPLPPESRDSVSHIRRAGRHLLRLIDEVLDISRIEAGRMTLKLEPVEAAEPLAEALELIAPLAAQRSVRIDAPVDSGCSIWADGQRVKQVLLNLLSNAVKYNRPGGEVTITCSSTAGGRVRMEVRDTGIGIRPENMGRLFTPFDRLDAEQTAVEGTGIGLSLTKRLVEAMNGTIGVESEPGVGTAVWVEFARAPAPGGSGPA